MAIGQFVKFLVGNEEFGVNIKQVREIIKLQEFLKVPNTPAFIEGLINLRGKVLTVFNLRKRLGLKNHKFNDNSKIIIVDLNNIPIGFTVDLVSEIVRISDDNIENTPPSVTSIDKRFLSGVAKLDEKLILMLDLTKVLSTEEEIKVKKFIEKNESNIV